MSENEARHGLCGLRLPRTLRAKLARLSPEDQARVAQEVQESVREFFPNEQMNFPAQAIIVTGEKPESRGKSPHPLLATHHNVDGCVQIVVFRWMQFRQSQEIDAGTALAQQRFNFPYRLLTERTLMKGNLLKLVIIASMFWASVLGAANLTRAQERHGRGERRQESQESREQKDGDRQNRRRERTEQQPAQQSQRQNEQQEQQQRWQQRRQEQDRQSQERQQRGEQRRGDQERDNQARQQRWDQQRQREEQEGQARRRGEEQQRGERQRQDQQRENQARQQRWEQERQREGQQVQERRRGEEQQRGERQRQDQQRERDRRLIQTDQQQRQDWELRHRREQQERGLPGRQDRDSFRQGQWRVIEQQRRDHYRDEIGRRQNFAWQRQRLLEQQRRRAQLRYQERYLEHQRQDQRRLQNWHYQDYGPYNYRYYRGSSYYETNQYGAEMLRRAVSNGYEEGYRAGQADREDGWQFNPQDAYAYQDASFGYDGYYVDLNEYGYYFREGFRRGYEDGYYGRSQYGRYSNGSFSILGSILEQILSLQLIR